MPEKKPESIWDIIRFTLITLLIVIPIRLYVAQPFLVRGESMVPTFADSEYLIVDELTYDFRTPERGEVVIFHYPKDQSKFFIKRVIGLPGETVRGENGAITVTTASGTPLTLTEPYIAAESDYRFEATLGPGEYFVMGDNRPASSDSRFWGPVSEDLIQGRVFLRVFPLRHFSLWPGAHATD